MIAGVLRSDARKEHWIALPDLLPALADFGLALGLSLLRQLLRWLSWFIDSSPWLLSADDSPINAPLPRANKRARKIDPRVKEAVVEWAHSETAAGSSGDVVKAMKRFRVKTCFLNDATAKEWHHRRVQEYWRAVKRFFLPGLRSLLQLHL